MKTFIHIFVLANQSLMAMDETGAAYICNPDKLPEKFHQPSDHGQWDEECLPSFYRQPSFDSNKELSPFAGLAPRLRSLSLSTEIEYNKDKKAVYVGVQHGFLEDYDFLDPNLPRDRIIG